MQPMEEVYQQYAQTVYRYLLSLTRDGDLAEELTQETFYQAIRSSDRFDGGCAVSTWLCAIAKNVLRTYRRKHPETEDVDEQTLFAPSAEAEAASEAGKMELLKQLHALREPYREVMYLRAFGNLSFREIGEVQGKTENWARVTFYRGKELLRKEVEEHE
ncbi:MAG: sigma-70 family RNA polymerase sigma factor [Ruminococcaceae bacterium]|nr:sigma-70 family RNA polymerase sigma factor [Oscillospiraceae bacterium]